MALPPIIFPAPPPWSNQDIVLYHGTLAAYAPAIETKVQVGLGKKGTDFGPGFYLTTFIYQAEEWAARKAAKRFLNRSAEAVMQITVSREALATLQTLSFIRGERDAGDYWSFVNHCRDGSSNHGRPGPQKSYDIVYGPVAGPPGSRVVYAGYDQIGFHTPAAEKVLNTGAIKRIK